MYSKQEALIKSRRSRWCTVGQERLNIKKCYVLIKWKYFFSVKQHHGTNRQERTIQVPKNDNFIIAQCALITDTNNKKYSIYMGFTRVHTCTCTFVVPYALS